MGLMDGFATKFGQVKPGQSSRAGLALLA